MQLDLYTYMIIVLYKSVIRLYTILNICIQTGQNILPLILIGLLAPWG